MPGWFVILFFANAISIYALIMYFNLRALKKQVKSYSSNMALMLCMGNVYNKQEWLGPPDLTPEERSQFRRRLAGSIYPVSDEDLDCYIGLAKNVRLQVIAYEVVGFLLLIGVTKALAFP